MAISFSNSSYANTDYRMSATQTGQTVSSDTSGEISKVSLSNAAANLTPGTTVSGEVVSKDGENVVLKMSNNQLIEAKLTGNAQINVGQKISFEVASSGGDKLALRPLYSNLATNTAAVSALKAASLPINNTTLAMTDRMMLEGMNINRNALTDMFKSVSTHQNASVETVVQMNKLGMPLSDENISQFENYRNFEHRITGDILDLAKGLGDVLSEGISKLQTESNPKELVDVLNIIDKDVQLPVANSESVDGLKEIIDLAKTLNDLNAEQPVENNIPVKEGINTNGELSTVIKGDVSSLVSESGNATVVDNIAQDVTAGDFIGIVKELVNEFSEEVAIAGNTPEADNQETVSENAPETLNSGNIIREGKNVEPNNIDGKAAEVGKSVDAGKSADAGKAVEIGNLTETVNTGEKISEGIKYEGKLPDINAKSDKTLMNLRNALTGVEMPEEEIAEQDENSVEKIRAKIGEKLAKLVKSDDFKELVKDSLKSQMSLEPKDIAKEGKIDELYERILKTSGKINQLMESMGRADSAVSNAATNISDNVNFMNHLNEFVNYVQLPLQMAGENANGELYVYTKKKNLKDNDGNFSALLHLDMEHLGPMDVYVTMKEYSKVNTHFYLASEELLDFVESHIDELTTRLKQKGYDTGVRVSKKEKGVAVGPIADEFTKNDEGNFPGVVSKLSFDVRA